MRSLKILRVLFIALSISVLSSGSVPVLASQSQSHATHFVSLKGPHLSQNETGCYTCHAEGQWQCQPDGPVFADMLDLDHTAVCDDCHSPGGAFDGVAMAKANWETGVYNSQFEVLPYWQGDSNYETGDIVMYKPDAVTQAYVALSTFTSEPDTPDGSKWKLIDDWTPSVEYQCGDLVLYNGKVWRSRFTHDSGTSVNPDYWELVQRTGAGKESLKPGKEKWCAGCHDDEPANSKKNGLGVDAPKVLGDNSAYGFYVSGHGRAAIEAIGMTGIEKECLDCHNSTFAHIDHDHRTYQVDELESPKAVMHAYKDSYRLKEDMIIPRGDYDPIDDSFPLCMDTCHDAHPHVFSDVKYCLTNFRKSTVAPQLHLTHLDDYRAWYDSDWDWDGEDDNLLDSNASCPTCHNVHGSPMDLDRTEEVTDYQPNPVMIRHGELISTPGTEDKVPAIDHCWLSFYPREPTNILSESERGTGDVWFVTYDMGCICHSVFDYDRIPGGFEEIVDMKIWTTGVDDNIEKTEFSPGEPVHYHLSFYLRGPFADGSWCVKTKEGESAAYHFPYESGWITPIVMEETVLSRGEHTACWEMTIPSDAEPGEARFYMELQMGTPDCLQLLNSDTQTHDFTVVEQQP